MSTKRKPSQDVPSHALPPLGKQFLMRQTPTIEPIDETNEAAQYYNNIPDVSDDSIPPPPPSSYPSSHEIIYADQVFQTNASSIPPMCDPLRILNTPNMSRSSTESTVSETSIPKDLRPAQPHDERDYFERLWAKNFELSEAEAVHTKPLLPTDYIPVGKRAKLLQISGYTLAKDPATGKLYTVFRLELQCHANEKRWTVYRRYDDLKALHTQLKAEGYQIPPLPAKSILRTFSKEFLKKRQADLQEWLQELLNPNKPSNDKPEFVADIHDSDTLRHFLTHLANHPPKLEEPSPSTSISNTKSSSCPNIFSNPRQTFSSTCSSYQHSSSMSSGNESSPALSKYKSVNDDSSNTSAQQEKNKLNVDDFEFIRVIGKGSFGKVLLVKKKVSNELYAMKILSKPTVIKNKQVEHTCTERRVLANVNHPFIVALHYAFQTPTKLYFVLDYCPGGDIFFHLSKYGCFPEIMAKFYCAEIVLALVHLHSLGIVYRDLKPENIMLDVDGHIKLADFGLAKEGITDTVNGTYTMCGTPEYLPPEILNRNGHGIAVDWWNLGMVLYEMLTGRPPWYTTDRMKLFLRLRKAELEFAPGMSDESMLFISQLLTREPELRLGSQSPEEILRHPFFYGIDWNQIYNKEIIPPFQPCQYSNPLEATNFEEAFTQMSINDNTEDDEAEGEPLPEKNRDCEKRRESYVRAQSHKSYTFWNFTYEGKEDDIFRQ